MTFDPNAHVIQLKSKQGSQDYLPVAWRIVWFREEHPQGTIETEELEYDLERECSVEAYAWNNETRRSEKVMKTAKGYARYRAVVTDGKGGRATGTKSECAANFADFGEKAETGSIGRALAALGYGTAFAPDLEEGDRIADAPVTRSQPHPPDENVNRSIHTSSTTAPSESSPSDAGITEQQVSSIRILCQKLGRRPPEDLEEKTFLQAKSLIGELNTQYRDSRKAL